MNSPYATETPAARNSSLPTANDDEHPEDDFLSKQLGSMGLHDHQTEPLFLCDAGYGIPREARPRKEKILAIARQLTNFLEWQHQQQQQLSARIQVVGCPNDATRAALEERTREIWNGDVLPVYVTFSSESLEQACWTLQNEKQVGTAQGEIIYLSPDAPESLDPKAAPPNVIVVGLLIDRRMQPNRSKDRADQVALVAKRWPLDECFANLSANEPLNVDCILEGMQQWHWNVQHQHGPSRLAFQEAAAQAMEHHGQRHPSRPVHIVISTTKQSKEDK